MKPTYLKPGEDPTQVERDLPKMGCGRWLWMISAIVGLFFGFALGAAAFAHAAPAHTVVLTPTPGPSPTPTATPTITPTPGPITATPGFYGTPLPTNPTCSNYLVHSGDSLAGIATKFRVAMSAIVKKNNIKNANAIRVGQVLQICGVKG